MIRQVGCRGLLHPHHVTMFVTRFGHDGLSFLILHAARPGMGREAAGGNQPEAKAKEEQAFQHCREDEP
jgi:hypothetical protein